MIKKLLIANRGEIALRIIRACKELGIATVAVHSTADENSLHVKLSDESVCIGPPKSSDSYLNPVAILSAAELTNADALHPGYGFMAEKAQFAEMVINAGLTWVGPTPESISKMGDKSVAKQSMKSVGIPVVPGSEGPLQDMEEAAKICEDIGYPVLLKAVSGGGGKGMRLVNDPDNLATELQMARVEAKAAFDDDSIYVEKFIEKPRHIEFQILGDNFGNIVHLGERDCSIQRRHQKLLEESPSPAVKPEIRDKMGAVIIAGLKKIGYSNAGTVELIMDQTGNFYFMEMNTRIQVEHPVTELVTGIDLVKEQIKIASGEKLSFTQEQIKWRGHAIECRINAEDAFNSFMPTPGKITRLHIPGGIGVRVDTHVYQEYNIPPFYDSMIAKLITHGADRTEALARMRRSLEEFIIEGVKSTIPFHLWLMDQPMFVKGEFTTKFLEENPIPKH